MIKPIILEISLYVGVLGSTQKDHLLPILNSSLMSVRQKFIND